MFGKINNAIGNNFVLNGKAKLVGELTTDSPVIISGDFEGIVNAKHVVVTKNGNFKGVIKTNSARISGKVNAQFECKHMLTITKTGCVIGDVTYGKLVVNNGGTCNGNIRESEVARHKAPSPQDSKSTAKGLISGIGLQPAK